VLLVELDHCLYMPAQHGLFTPSPRDHNASLGGDCAHCINACSTIVNHLTAASTISRIHTHLLTVFGVVSFTYLSGLYYAHTTPVHLGEPIPATIPIYIPDHMPTLLVPLPNFAHMYARIVVMAQHKWQALTHQLNLYEEEEEDAAEYPDANDGNCMHTDDDPESL
jgi:hypothetical protein